MDLKKQTIWILLGLSTLIANSKYRMFAIRPKTMAVFT